MRPVIISGIIQRSPVLVLSIKVQVKAIPDSFGEINFSKAGLI